MPETVEWQELGTTNRQGSGSSGARLFETLWKAKVPGGWLYRVSKYQSVSMAYSYPEDGPMWFVADEQNQYSRP